jgi:GT2 family glycosyltransferase
MTNTLALCIIVKNEETYLPYCLGCIYPYLDELFILDTGSTDRTLDIAESFCELVPRGVVLQMPWKHDFAFARNVSQGGVTASHIIWLDGDEVLDDNSVKKIKNELIQDQAHDFWLMPRVNFWKDLKHMWEYPDSQYKMYRNIGLKWQHKIHETIYSEKFKNRLKHTDVHIFHYAYVKDTSAVATKMANYIKIENPDMDDQKIRECSTQHSYFKNEFPPGTVDYTLGIYPEVFNRLEVTKKTIKEKNGKTLVVFKDKRFYSNFNKEDLNEKYKDVAVSIVIATYNKLEFLRECIFSIYNHTKTPFEIVLVDNGSSENIREFVDLLKKDNITFIRSETNLGFSAGYNLGIEKTKHDYILVLNNDTLFSSDFVAKMLDVHFTRQNYGDAGLIGPISNNNPSENGTLVLDQSHHEFDDYINALNKSIQTTDYKSYMESSWLTGLCYLFHRSLLDELAQIQKPKTQGVFFDERLKIYHNDTELNWRIHHRIKKKLWIAREAFLWHYGKVTVNTLTQEEFHEMKKDSERVLKELWPEIAGDMVF